MTTEVKHANEAALSLSAMEQLGTFPPNLYYLTSPDNKTFGLYTLDSGVTGLVVYSDEAAAIAMGDTLHLSVARATFDEARLIAKVKQGCTCLLLCDTPEIIPHFIS